MTGEYKMTSSRGELDEIVAREGLDWVINHLKDNRRIMAQAATAKQNPAAVRARMDEVRALHELQVTIKSDRAMAKRIA